MLQRYFSEPYRFIPPYRSTFWCRVCRPIVRPYLRRLALERWQFQGLERLQTSLREGAGIVLAANHCRWADAAVLGLLSLEARQFFYYLVSY